MKDYTRRTIDGSDTTDVGHAHEQAGLDVPRIRNRGICLAKFVVIGSITTGDLDQPFTILYLVRDR